MKRFVVAALLVVLALLSCVSTSSTLDEFFTLHGAVLEPGPMGFTMTSPGPNAMALRPVGPYVEELVCEVRIQAAVSEGPQNGFLVLADRSDPGGTILVNCREEW